MRRIMKKIIRKKIEPEIRKMWGEVVVPVEQVIEQRDEVFRQFALTNNHDYSFHAVPFDLWGSSKGLTSLNLGIYAKGENVTYRYVQPYFRPTNLNSKFYEGFKKDQWFHDAFDELSKSGLFEVFYSDLKHAEDRISRVESIMCKSLGYSVECDLHLKDDSWKIPIKEFVRISYGIDKASFYFGDLEIHESRPEFPPWGGIRYISTSGHGERIPKTIDKFLRRDPDEDSKCFQDNLRTLKQASEHYYRLMSDEEVQKTFRDYEKNPMKTLKKVRNLVKKEFPDNTEIASYLIEDATKRTSRKIKESAQRIF